PNAKLVVASEIDEARGRAFGERWGCEVVGDYHQLFARDDVDIVALTLPHWLHCPVAIEAAQAGKHIIIEKPMADSVEECDRMIDRLTYILDSRVAAVKAFVGTRYHKGLKTDDCAMAYLELESGVPCTIAHTGYKDHPGAGVEQGGGQIVISCTEAMLKVYD